MSTHTQAPYSGFDTHACAEIVHTRYQDRAHSIDDVIALLQDFKVRGAYTVSITDGYFGHAFNARFEGVPNFDSPRHVILRPVNNLPDFDGITRETSGMLEKSKDRDVCAHDDLMAALRDTLDAFRECIGRDAFADFEASNPAVIRARAALAKATA